MLLTEASWDKEQASSFLSFLFTKMKSLAPKSASNTASTEDKNSKKRERAAPATEESDAKRRKTNDNDNVATASANETASKSASAEATQDTQGSAFEESKPLSAAERLAKIKAARNSSGSPIGAVTREPGVDKFNAKRDREFSSMSTYTAPRAEGDEDVSPVKLRSQRQDREGGKRIVSTSGRSRKDKHDTNGRHAKDQGDDHGDHDEEGNGDKKKKPAHGRPHDQQRCVYYPNCSKGEDCPFFHPTEDCKLFPNCPHGDNCDFVHPPCKFGDNCARRPYCQFAHSLASANRAMSHFPMMGMGMGMPMMHSAPPCKNGFACPNKPHCTFTHPLVACRFGNNCRNGMMCQYSHAAPCRNGEACTIVSCKFAHPAPGTNKPDPATVSSLSATLPTTPGKEDTSQVAETADAE